MQPIMNHISPSIKEPLISVLLPCFNAEKWIYSSLISLTRQTYKNIEILIFNDGSHDETINILEKLSAQDSRIKIIDSPENKGIVYALNHLCSISSGDYIARMDADDIAVPTRLEQQLTWIINKDIDLCGTWFSEFGQGISRTTRWPESHDALEAALLFQNSICHPTIMGKRKVFAEFPYREEFRLAEDYDFFARAIKKYKFNNIPKALLRYRRHPDQATQASKEKMEAITKNIRITALESIGIIPNDAQKKIHNMIRSPNSIFNFHELELIETWILSLLNDSKTAEYNRIIASQWIRACIRAAPLGCKMRRKFFSSPLFLLLNTTILTRIDITILSILKLNYNSKIFKWLRRIGLSA